MKHRIDLWGNLGRDPEMRYMPDGTAITNFSMACSSYKKDGNATMWVRVSFFGKQAENANQYLKKGSKVFVSGELDFDPQTGGPKTFSKQDGSIGVSFEVKGKELLFLSSKGDVAQDDSDHAPVQQAVAVKETEHIPF